jgi:hypothetical protein
MTSCSADPATSLLRQLHRLLLAAEAALSSATPAVHSHANPWVSLV